jgi:hypothetical protein
MSTAPAPVTTTTVTTDARRLAVWRQHLVESLWRPGRRNAPRLRAELRRVEHQLCDLYWPRWREVV